jgi:hypothetical protein
MCGMRDGKQKACTEQTWCGCKVSGMILLHSLKGPVQLDYRIDMSMHVSTCAIYDFNLLKCVCLYVLLQKKSDHFLEQ